MFANLFYGEGVSSVIKLWCDSLEKITLNIRKSIKNEIWQFSAGIKRIPLRTRDGTEFGSN